jgi:hypothetical protein
LASNVPFRQKTFLSSPHSLLVGSPIVFGAPRTDTFVDGIRSLPFENETVHLLLLHGGRTHTSFRKSYHSFGEEFDTEQQQSLMSRMEELYMLCLL